MHCPDCDSKLEFEQDFTFFDPDCSGFLNWKIFQCPQCTDNEWEGYFFIDEYLILFRGRPYMILRDQIPIMPYFG